MGKQLDDIKYGLLSDHELSWLENKIANEILKRKKSPTEYIEAIYADDGSEGMFCTKENFHKIPSNNLHAYIAQVLNQSGQISFSLEKYDKKEYQENCAQYEWQLDDGSNTKVLDYDEEDDEEDGMSNN